MNSSLSVIIVTYNNQLQISDCLQSVFKNIKKFNTNIVFIDNNSQDKTLNIISKLTNSYQNIFILKNKKNIGFAKAVNQGIKFVREKFNSDFYFLFNPDAILKDDCLEKMFNSELSSGRLELSSALIINPRTKQSWFSGAKINWLKFKTKHSKGGSTSPREVEPPKNTDYLTGCSLLISKQTINKIGFFDERFFLYYEDADFSLRAKKAGLELKIIPEAICYHEESQSSTSEIKNYYLVKSGLIFFHKHYLKILLPYFWIIFYLRFLYHKYISKKKIILKALIDFNKNYK